MRSLLPIVFWFWSCFTNAQAEETSSYKITDMSKTSLQSPENNKPEILSSGFIDIINNGQVNASARLIRLLIGEPGKLVIPLSVYSGVSSNNFQNSSASQRSNDILVANLINPIAGLTNFSIDGIVFLKNDTANITRPGLLYHIGERILTGIKTGASTDPATGRPVNFLNAFSSVGLYFQTGAWDRNNAKNMGITWMALRYIACYTDSRQLEEIISTIQTNGFYHGYSIAWGVDITNFVNVRAVYYKYVKKPEIDHYFPLYQFSFNYSLKK
jgi:hypothetical protein